jgi:hypothetical protein
MEIGKKTCFMFMITQKETTLKTDQFIESQKRNMSFTKSSLRGYPKLKNGDVYEFVDKMRYGDELIFMYRGEKYFLQGYRENDGICTTYLDRWYPPANDYIWVGKGEPHKFPVDEFLS